MLRISDNPAVVYPEGLAISEIAGPWWVGHTKARFEKAFAHDLAGKEIAYFLPMVEKTTFSGGRKRKGMMPLFGGYVFFAGGEQARYTALVTGRLCQVIEVVDQARLIGELSALQAALAGGMQLDPYPFAVVGQRCRITAGALRGYEGVIVQRDEGSARLVLEVGILGQGASVEVDAGMVQGME